VSSVASAAPAPAKLTQKGPAPEEIQKAIEELGSPRFAVRERASKFLWDAGEAAEPALRNASNSKDEETSNRAKTILEKFDWGIYPDTPAEVIKLIDKFKGGEPPIRQEAVGELMRLKPTRFATLRKVISHEQNEESRLQMFQTMAFQARQAVPELIVANRLDEANELLEICTSPGNHNALGDFAAFQHLRGRVPEAIRNVESLRAKGSELDRQRASETLAYLHRLNKDWPAARKAAELAKNPQLLKDIAWESNDWAYLAKHYDNPEDGQPDYGGGEKAAYYRMAGNTAEFEKIIGDLKKQLTGVEGDDGSAYILAYNLLLNRRGSDAATILKDHPKHSPDLAFDLLCAQFRYKEAFALADQVAKELDKEEVPATLRDDLDIQRGKMLAALGDKDAATQVFRGLFDRVFANVPGVRQRTAVNLVKAAAGAGMRDLAIEFAGKALALHQKAGLEEMAASYFDPLLGEQKYAAQVWWHAYRQEKPDAEPSATMARVLEIAEGKPDRKKVDHLAELVGQIKPPVDPKEGLRDTIRLDPFLPKSLQDYAAAEAYRLGGVSDKAEEFYKKAAEAKAEVDASDVLNDVLDDDDFPSPVPAQFKYRIAYGDFLLGQKRFKDAAEQFHKAWELAKNQALPLYLQGSALTKAGDEKEGERLKGLAHWVALGNEEARSRFSDELAQRGFDADSKREVDLILATGWYRTHYVGNVHLRHARQEARQKNFAAAAASYEKDVVSLFRTGAHFVEPKAYLTVPEQARTYRVRALLAEGKTTEALAEAKVGLAALPGNVEMAIALVPELEKAGKKAEADEIYKTVKTAFETAIADFGNSSELRNGLAWTMVNTNRDLDAARKHAEKAVQLMPKAAGYIDTLAEINFRQKDRPKALELMKQCAELEPKNPYYRKQLERFEKKPFDSPLPDEETGEE
jgi:Tfp pilus assembly protein PilF